MPPAPGAPPTQPASTPPDRGRPSWAVVGVAAVLAAGLAAGAVAFLGARNDQESTGTTASTVPVEELAPDAPEAAGSAADPAPTTDAGGAPVDDGSTGSAATSGDIAASGGSTGEEAVDPDPADADLGEGDVTGTDAAATEPERSDADTTDEPTGDTAQPSGEAAPESGEPDIADDAPVPESRAVVRNGQIYLEGAVPTQAASDEIEALAAEILGPDNVFNEYVIDERAGDPSLGNITVEDTINFATGSSVLLPESEGLLTQGLALMAIRPAVVIEIVGHTDDRGSDEYNQRLSEARAASVKQWFVDRGVDPNRLITSGAGESQPIADNTTEEGRRLNRRIQLFLQNILGDG